MLYWPGRSPPAPDWSVHDPRPLHPACGDGGGGDELTELHYITDIANLDSILRHGLLSFSLAKQHAPASFADSDVQRIRARVRVPGGRPLHDHVNLYVNCRNATMYRLHQRHADLCVLAIDPAVVDAPGAVVSDRNAAAGAVRFASSPDGLALLDRSTIFAEYWTHPDDTIAERDHKQKMCAEVLVPDRVAPSSIMRVYVSCEPALYGVRQVTTLPVRQRPQLFFQP